MRGNLKPAAMLMVALLAGCGGGGNGDGSGADDGLGSTERYDTNAALLALLNGQFAEGKATAKIDGLIFELKTRAAVAPNPPPPVGAPPADPALRNTSVMSTLTASGMSDYQSLQIAHRRAPLSVQTISLYMSGETSMADHEGAPVTVPTAATIGDSQTLLQGGRYRLNYGSGAPESPLRVGLPGTLALGWKLEDAGSTTAWLCLVTTLNDGNRTLVDDHCFSIHPDGRPQGRFRAVLADEETGERYRFD